VSRKCGVVWWRRRKRGRIGRSAIASKDSTRSR
jgi:hypothetical protein